MREVGAFEAKNKFGQLLDRVEAGEAVAITRAPRARRRRHRPAPPIGNSPHADRPALSTLT
jgi:hypothetical protein